MIHLSVNQQFGKYKRGDMIVDSAEIKEVLASPNRHDVVQVISKPEHISGDFWLNDAALAEKRNPRHVAE